MIQVKNINVHELLNRLRQYFQESDITKRYAKEAPPLRSELFTLDQLGDHGRWLAAHHEAKVIKAKEKLLKRLAQNEKILIEVHNLLSEAIRKKQMISPAGEWILDNFYLIEEHIRTGKKHLPKGYSEGLPRLLNTDAAGLPRVYHIALELISHSDGRIDMEGLTTFIRSYQEHTILKIGELWAIPIMLRLALIENLRRVSVRVAIDRINQSLADYWATLMVETAEKDPKNLILVIADMARSTPPMESSFVSEMIRQLMWQGSSLALPLTWIEQRLSEINLTSNELVTRENQKQAADQVSISNCIGSLRFLGSVEWHEFVEKMSIVEHTLRNDPAGVYAKMDFSTRDRYRHKLEGVAKHSKLSENDIALSVVDLSKKAAQAGEEDTRKIHVGYYLIDDGFSELSRIVKQKLTMRERLLQSIKRHPLTVYAGGIILFSVLLAVILVRSGYIQGVHPWILILTGIFAFIGASQLTTSLMNWVVTMYMQPELLPRMDFSDGIPEQSKTLVVVPTMLTRPKQIESLVEALEVRFLANKSTNLHYALLTDFPDAKEEHMPADEMHLNLAKEKIEELNIQYASSGTKFYLFHRPRKWNKYDKIWMGYERKRGKLGELNSLLRGEGRDNFSLIVGDADTLKGTKYILTLDTDTLLPRDVAHKLTGTMAHPLNTPLYNEKKHRIVKGYGLLQPRVSVSIPRSGYSIYAQIHGNEPGIDPYTRLSSDLYQDLFDEGSFIGKGIYDIDAFETALKDQLPENRILSHDLLEGCYTRSGLISDVQLYEEYPTHYSADVNRRHRWIRGDWQVGYWFLPMVPDAKNRFRKNKLSGLSRWKIFDNLRRSLVPLSLTLLLLIGWTIMHAAWLFTVAVLGIVVLPSLLISIWNIFHKPKEIRLFQHIAISFRAITEGILREAFMFICLPYEAYYTLDAIFRTSWRMLFTKNKLLEWVPSGIQEHSSDKTIVSAYRSMWINPVIAGAVFVFLVIYAPVKLIAVTPILISWALAPLVAWKISKPFKKQDIQLSENQHIFLRKLARRTWAFFETFINEGDNWLPPDNYQESPGNMVAHRTSPTNIGLALLSNLTAYDFGYITADHMLERVSNTIDSMKKMERFRGHLYNWYDTKTLQPLQPRYVSTVDSGNMAGHLLTLRQGLLHLEKEKIFRPVLLQGLLDTIRVVKDEIPVNTALEQLELIINDLVKNKEITAAQLLSSILEINVKIDAIKTGIVDQNDNNWWLEQLADQCMALSNELSRFYIPIDEATTPEHLKHIYNILKSPTLWQIANLEQQAELAEGASGNSWLASLLQAAQPVIAYAQQQLEVIDSLAANCNDFADLDYEFLYDRSKYLLSIGYNMDDHQRDAGFYDLLASEARLTNFVAIAQGKLPQESWFALNRSLTTVSGKPLLISWSGSMFEYLMPMLVMPTYEDTLLDMTHKTAVARQIEYGAERGIPWGISESGYNMLDANLNYQYRAFGVPKLGLKRGLAQDMVIAPYATVLALMVNPEAACANLEQLSAAKFSGKYGMYEAVDYTPSRLPRGQQSAIIKSYMAHHQGMSFLSLSYLLLNQPMQKRFEAELQFQATLLLLQERVPKATVAYPNEADIEPVSLSTVSNTETRMISTPHTTIPEVQLLSNGKYNVMITNAGGGYSKWKGLAVSRWHEDTTRDNWGTFCYIRDLENGAYWSNTFQPTLKEPDHYDVTFSQGRAEFRRKDNNIEVYTEVVVSPEDDIEMRRLHITNRSKRKRTIEVTSYTEVVLNNPAADSSHPAFSNLFVQSEIIEQKNALLFTRRPRSATEQQPFMMHLMMTHDANVQGIYYETDRSRFTGRGNTTVSPSAMEDMVPLSNTQGAVLDPIAAIQHAFIIGPEETIILDVVTGIGNTHEECMALIEKYQDKHHKDRVFELAWTHSQVVLRQINASEADAQLYAKLAGSIIFSNPALRAAPAVIALNERGQSGLWGYAISGDIPIVLLEIADQANIELARQLVQAHAYWRLKGLLVDLVIWNEDHGGYRQNLQSQVLGLVAAGTGQDLTGQPGSIFVRSYEQVAEEDRALFYAVARVVISDANGPLAAQLAQANPVKKEIPAFIPSGQRNLYTPSGTEVPDLQLYNGLGGFNATGDEYVIITDRKKKTPAPWINVLANPDFGTIVTESGQSYTWAENAHEYRITPWDNDPVSDSGGEAFYIRDEESGNFWSPTLLPAAGESDYVTRHGFGYSVFEHTEQGIVSTLQEFVHAEEPVKFFVLKLKNISGERRKLSVTGYIELVLGDLRPKTATHIITAYHSDILIARNPYNKEFDRRIVFFDTDDAGKKISGDRTLFIGRHGTLQSPAAMEYAHLHGKTGAGLDPCLALQTNFILEHDTEHTVVFRLGAGIDLEEVIDRAQRFKGTKAALRSLEQVVQYWKDKLGTVRIETPNKSLDILANGWLMYQTMACRLWARSGYYQSGGAFGFRDQLQDVLAVLHTEPSLARKQILLCAAHQFAEGDVQHWWHPPLGRGVRTRCSDDMLWLPYVTASYVIHTGDEEILSEYIPYLEGRLLNPEEESYYDLPRPSTVMGTLYQHCVAAIKKGMQYGVHGLPLMGSGDWNDGMDMVGREGKGESVWLGFFLYYVLHKFTDVAVAYKDEVFANYCREQSTILAANIEKSSWDGKWYRRAYFDDGTPLGSSLNEECSIDSISQGWAVLSGAADAQRARMAIDSADKRLVNKEGMLIQLLDPPFDKSALNPGYIKGYVPGIRENGGQYTHAAVWLIMAHARLGNAERAWELTDMINPLNHANTEDRMKLYKVEPYVMAADVYSIKQNCGRGGWTWYTGSAGWMYQLVVEWLLGLRRQGDQLGFNPCIPKTWDSFKVIYKYKTTTYNITIYGQTGEFDWLEIEIDGVKKDDKTILLIDNGKTHEVVIRAREKVVTT